MIRTHFLFLNSRDYFAVHVHVEKIFAVMAIISLNSRIVGLKLHWIRNR